MTVMAFGHTSTLARQFWKGSFCKPLRAFASQPANIHGPPRIIRSDVQDIVFHFAVEEYLMNVAKLSGPLMYLWRPAPVVTIGRHQNPWKECVLSQLEQDNVALVRRKSGGGAVFQDPGCSVFTFISPSGVFSIDRNLDIIIGALGRMGVQAEKKGRNDLTCDDKKISGSAFKHAPDRQVSLHHGTLLVDTDMQALQRYLTPDKRKLQAKGIASVGARVMNLGQNFPNVDHNSLCEALIAEFRDQEGGHEVQVEELSESSEMAQAAEFKAVRAEMGDKEWRLGKTPEFSHQLETRIDGVAIFDVQMKVIAGKIDDVTIFSDALYPEVISEAMQALKNAEYGRSGIGNALSSIQPKFAAEEGPTRTLEALKEWMVSSVDD
eukprot:TRINITY_DN35498_c0_g1_i2.p1 TRINITY_DN35498_c0_g1~~TRINITY_DN35498_c0_g1_i2.p1  ORF type:complete len:379 (-),score=77.34 TRINITY_DN35498_c0_g1_i2:100-1236(-)